jgi:ubiquitin-conjugating enzyme E2 J2
MFITPNGRFALNQRICMSMSDFHPETWSPLWSVGSLLTGIVSFMNTDEGTVGSVTASPADRRNFALRSMDFNAKDSTFCALFGDAMTLFSRNDEILKAKSELRAMECAKRTKADAGKLNTMSKSVDTLILYEKKLGDEGDEIVSKSSDVSVELFTL